MIDGIRTPVRIYFYRNDQRKNKKINLPWRKHSNWWENKDEQQNQIKYSNNENSCIDDDSFEFCFRSNITITCENEYMSILHLSPFTNLIFTFTDNQIIDRTIFIIQKTISNSEVIVFDKQTITRVSTCCNWINTTHQDTQQDKNHD